MRARVKLAMVLVKWIAWRLLLYAWLIGKGLGFFFLTGVIATQTAANGLHDLAEFLK